jgi:DNA mismatch repair protein MutH
MFAGEPPIETIEDVVEKKFRKYIGKTDEEIQSMLGLTLATKPKNYKRLLANWILTNSGSNDIKELTNANVTLRVITLEHTGALKESISFQAFDYKDLITQVWYDEDEEKMADFHAELEMNRFLFVVFQKIAGSEDIVLKKIKFWNFPIGDLPKVERVFDMAVDCINKGKYSDMPKISGNTVAHVRPHGKDARDTIETPQGTREIKRCFWLNAKYIQKALEA